MALYRANPRDGIAWVTGASTGIGRQVALDLARRGYTVAASARNEANLSETARKAEGLPGRIIPFPCDVTDQAATLDAVEAIETVAGPIVLALFNAGTYYPVRGEALDMDSIINTYRINVFGVVHGLVPVAKKMAAHGRGQIVITGSATAYAGLPMASAYGSSKAALNSMAASLKFDFDRLNIRIQVVNPGFVETPLTEKNEFPMPGLMKVEDAAQRIVRGIESGGFDINFPRRLIWALKLVHALPYPAYFALVSRAMGWKDRPAAKDGSSKRES